MQQLLPSVQAAPILPQTQRSSLENHQSAIVSIPFGEVGHVKGTKVFGL